MCVLCLPSDTLLFPTLTTQMVTDVEGLRSFHLTLSCKVPPTETVMELKYKDQSLEPLLFNTVKFGGSHTIWVKYCRDPLIMSGNQLNHRRHKVENPTSKTPRTESWYGERNSLDSVYLSGVHP